MSGHGLPLHPADALRQLRLQLETFAICRAEVARSFSLADALARIDEQVTPIRLAHDGLSTAAGALLADED